MYYDALTLAAIADELRGKMLGGRVQRIVQPSPLSLGIEIYAGQRYQLLLDAHPQTYGALLVPAKLRRGIEAPSPLLLRLRKHVENACLEAVQQPSLERILWLTFSGEYGPVDLVCELMGRYSNLILVGPDGIVMEAIKHIPASLNRYRVTLPGQPYVPPPAQDKEHPLLLTPARLRALLDEPAEGPLWRRLLDAVNGISPILAREIVYRAMGQHDPTAPLTQNDCINIVSVIEALLSLPKTHAWAPCVAFEGDGPARHAVAYAPYMLTHWPDREPATSISDAIYRVLEARRSFDPYRAVRERLRAMIDEQIERQQARLASLEQSLAPASEIEGLKARGNAILAMAWAIKPGQKELIVDLAQFSEMPQAPSEMVSIPLDASLSVSENAQRFFREYRRLQAAAAQVPQLMQQAENEIAYLRQLRTEVDLAQDRPQLDEVEQELAEAGYGRPQKGHKLAGTSRPLSVRAPDGTLILVGRNSRQNHEITFRRATPNDIWLHAHGVPGSHVIIKSAGAPVSEETLRLAARLAALNSAARQEGKVQVDFTERRYVCPVKDGHPGMVTYRNERTLSVTPRIDDSWEEP